MYEFINKYELIISDTFLYKHIDVIIKMPKLATLKIDFSLDKFEEDKIIKLSKLKTLINLELSFIFNILTKLPQSIFDITSLRTLNINNIDLEVLPDNIRKLYNLQELRIYFTKISTLPKSIGNLSNLKKLEVELNEITHLPDSIGLLHNLESLSLFDNQLITLPETIGQLHKLQGLDVKRNDALFRLPDSINTLSNIRELSLSITNDTAQTFNNLFLPSLEVLEVDSEVNSVFDKILSYTHLKKLYIHSSDLLRIPNEIEQLVNLKTGTVQKSVSIG